MIKNYLSDRILHVGNGGKFGVTCGVPQGSMLGPTLWNAFNDDILRQEVPEGVKLLAYADDLAMLVERETKEEIGARVREAANKITRWMTRSGLRVAPEKTEAVVLVGRRKRKKMEIQVPGAQINTIECVKYLGVVLEGISDWRGTYNIYKRGPRI